MANRSGYIVTPKRKPAKAPAVAKLERAVAKALATVGRAWRAEA